MIFERAGKLWRVHGTELKPCQNGDAITVNR